MATPMRTTLPWTFVALLTGLPAQELPSRPLLTPPAADGNATSTMPETAPNLAIALYRSGRPAEAIAAAERAVEMAPREQTALDNLARFAFAQGKYALALQAAEHWVAAQPTAATAWQMLAEVLLATDETPVRTRARDAARKAAELAADPETLLLLARATAACGERIQAEELLERLRATPSLSAELSARIDQLAAQLTK